MASGSRQRRRASLHNRRIVAARRGECTLTVAEWRAVEGLTWGLRPVEIAASCGVSVHTIRTQLKRAMSKAGVHSQAALVARALRSKQPLITSNRSIAAGMRASPHIHHLGDARSKRWVSNPLKRRV
jgi:Bacterial regulatory proteins, luxR family